MLEPVHGNSSFTDNGIMAETEEQQQILTLCHTISPANGHAHAQCCMYTVHVHQAMAKRRRPVVVPFCASASAGAEGVRMACEFMQGCGAGTSGLSPSLPSAGSPEWAAAAAAAGTAGGAHAAARTAYYCGHQADSAVSICRRSRMGSCSCSRRGRRGCTWRRQARWSCR